MLIHSATTEAEGQSAVGAVASGGRGRKNSAERRKAGKLRAPLSRKAVLLLFLQKCGRWISRAFGKTSAFFQREAS